ncbi:hypothetical protein [Mesorhizobium silamurunense]|uniref:hypothetical protein n=1 Tax=Mesorhizobium silamurunense TaxID=499528 RepID=UPI00177EDA20|nr:hypothetical protein [Mesorhizobium silamurunense]
MYSDREWVKAISKLTRLTIERKVVWELIDDYPLSDTRRLDRAFRTTQEGKTYIVFSFEQQLWTDEETYVWDDRYGFDIWQASVINTMEYRIASSPSVAAINNLFKSVEGQFAQDQNALGFLLTDDDDA